MEHKNQRSDPQPCPFSTSYHDSTVVRLCLCEEVSVVCAKYWWLYNWETCPDYKSHKENLKVKN